MVAGVHQETKASIEQPHDKGKGEDATEGDQVSQKHEHRSTYQGFDEKIVGAVVHRHTEAAQLVVHALAQGNPKCRVAALRLTSAEFANVLELILDSSLDFCLRFLQMMALKKNGRVSNHMLEQ